MGESNKLVSNSNGHESSHITSFVEVIEITDQYILTEVFDHVNETIDYKIYEDTNTTIEVLDITNIYEHITVLHYIDIDETGVLLTCRSKFKARQKSIEKKNDKLQNDDSCTDSPTANEISKKRRLSFLRKRRKYSNNKDEQINLLNENEINKSKTDKTLKAKEDNNIVESKTTSNTLKDYNSSQDDSEKPQLIFLNEKELINKPETLNKEEFHSTNKNIGFKTKINIKSNENINKAQFAANTPCIDLGNLLDNKGAKNDTFTKLESENNTTNNSKTIVSNNLSQSINTLNVHNLNNTHEQTSLNNYTEVLAEAVVNDSLQEASNLFKKIETASDISCGNHVIEDTKCIEQSKLNKNQFEFLSDVKNSPASKIESKLDISECNNDSICKLNLNDKIENNLSSSVVIDDYSESSSDLVITNNKKINKAGNKTEVNCIFIDENTNFLRDKHHLNKKNTDRPLSGYAEKLAELLADEDDLEFLESDDELNESAKIIKETLNSVEPTPESTQEVDNASKTEEKSVANSTPNKKNKRGRSRGDRPMSLFEQDMLNDILKVTKNFEREDDEKSVSSNNIGNSIDGIDTDDEILEDEILPVKATIEILRNNIVMPRRKISNYSDTSFDEYMRSHNTPFNHITSDRPLTLRKAAVLDAGCGILKAGLCGETKPSCYCPSVIGVPRRFSQDVSKMKKPYYVGDEAWEVAGMLQIEHPIKQEINNWSDVTSIIEHLMEHELGINDNEHPILMTEMGLTSKKHREKLTEIMFEQFGVPSFYLANQSVLALYSMGMMSGVCLNSGFYNTQAIPIYEGHTIPHAISQLDIGGEQVTNYLGRLLQQSAQPRSFSTSSEKLVLNSMKQSLCYVSQDAKKEETFYKTQSKFYESYVLPDGQEIEVGAERFIAPEVLFDPHLLGLNQPSTTQLVTQTMELVNSELRDIFLQNILVTGGNTKLKGYSARLENELATENSKIKITCADDPLLATWIGGSIISSISAYRDQWMTIDQYTEHGSKLVHMLCF